MRPMIIALEGLDGCGKTTQHRLLSERLRAKGYVCQNFAMLPPGRIREAVLHEPYLTAKQRLMLLKTAAESTRLAIELAVETAPDKTVILMDRAYDTFVAYQGYGENLMREIQLVDQIFVPLRDPDLTFFIDVSVETSRRRLLQRQTQADQFETKPDAFFERVRQGFLSRLIQPHRFHICGEQSQEVIQATIWEYVKERLKESS